MAVTEPEQLTAGLHEAFLLVSRNRTERQWLKGYCILTKRAPTNFTNKLWQTGKFLFHKHFVWSCTNVLQIEKTLVYGIVCATKRTNDTEVFPEGVGAGCYILVFDSYAWSTQKSWELTK